MCRYRFNFILLTLFTSLFFLLSANAFAGFEVGAKSGFDSNIDRAVEDGMSDSYVTGFLSFTKETGEGTDIDWSLNLGIEGTGYADSSDLNYGMATISPAIIFYPTPRWRVDISPFGQAVKVSDEEQSALAFGGNISMKQLWGRKFYTGEYFVYTDSKADVDIYSYKEKAAGAFIGMNWTDAFWSEIGYEFSRGDSFRAVGEVTITEVETDQVSMSQISTSQIGPSQGGSGQGGSGQDGSDQDGSDQSGSGQGGTGNSSPRYSEAYNEYIISEPVDRQTIGVNMGYQFTRHFYSFINYGYTTYKGDAGDAKIHTGILGIGFNF